MADSDVNVVAAEDGTTWVEITSVGVEEDANLIKGFLEAEGIPANVEMVKFSMEPVTFGAMGDIRVYVPAEDEQRALELLRQREQEYERLDDDDDTLVTDDGPVELDDGAQVESDDGTTPSS